MIHVVSVWAEHRNKLTTIKNTRPLSKSVVRYLILIVATRLFSQILSDSKHVVAFE